MLLGENPGWDPRLWKLPEYTQGWDTWPDRHKLGGDLRLPWNNRTFRSCIFPSYGNRIVLPTFASRQLVQAVFRLIRPGPGPGDTSWASEGIGKAPLTFTEDLNSSWWNFRSIHPLHFHIGIWDVHTQSSKLHNVNKYLMLICKVNSYCDAKMTRTRKVS